MLTSPYAIAAGLGAITGMRSLLAPALVSHVLSQNNASFAGGPAAWLASDKVAGAFKALASGELLMDKAPFAPDRVDAPLLAGRAAFGALAGAGAASAAGQRAAVGAAVGAFAALASTYVTFHLRRQLGRRLRLPDTVVAVAEDALALNLGRRLVSALA